MTIRPSRILLLTLMVMHGLAMWAVGLTGLPVTMKGLLLAALASSLVWQHRIHYRNKDASTIRSISVDSKQALWLGGLSEEPQQAELKSAWLGPGVGVAALSSRGRTYRLVWMPDSADREALRRWRVWLRWMKV